ncbi:MAG: type II toxin-antitoxin system RelE/ParE family toxin [Opitutaceae bacterium]|nr:type II toxin-antitoxin system RelE/ParE family toxin [Opitutaceae bacterium]
MTRYAVNLSARALDWLIACRDATLKTRISRMVDALAVNPRPPGCKKLKGEEEVWRVRVGDYRILYEVRDAQLVVLVIDIANRAKAYR